MASTFGFCKDLKVNELVLWGVLFIITLRSSPLSSGRHVRKQIKENFYINFEKKVKINR